MVRLANGLSEGHQQRTVLGKEGQVRLGNAKMPKLKWETRFFRSWHVNTTRPLMIQLTAHPYVVAFQLCKPVSKSYLEQYKSVVGQWMPVSTKALRRTYPKGCQTLDSNLSHRINPGRARLVWQFLCRCIAWGAWGSTHNTCSGTPDWSWTTAISPSF